jgi:hypothetical protein
MYNVKNEYPQSALRALINTYAEYGIAGNSRVCEWLLGRKPTSFATYVRGEMARYKGEKRDDQK